LRESTRVLDEICSLDAELYEYVNKLLTERVKKCRDRNSGKGGIS